MSKNFNYRDIIEDKKVLNFLDHYYGWYEGAADRGKIWFYTLSTTSIILNVSIPIFNTFRDKLEENTIWITTVISSLVAVINGILLLFNFQEKRIRYRNTSEKIKMAIMRCHKKTLENDNHKKNESYKILLDELENICKEENSMWLEAAKKETESEKDK